MSAWELKAGDCVEVMRGMATASVDACVTDPPYELGFMGKSWDASGIAYGLDLWREVLRVLKPGGHLLAFGGTRTYHRMAVAIEDAGFEVRDSLHWIYGTGFPKSLAVDKAIDAANGDERPVVGAAANWGASTADAGKVGFGDYAGAWNITSAASAAWTGWGTALKPAHEPIVLARKPLAGTVAANVLKHGTGALNIDGCRIGTEKRHPGHYHDGGSVGGYGRTLGGFNGSDRSSFDASAGRWPANILLSHLADCGDECADGCAVAALDRQSGASKSVGGRIGKKAQGRVANVPAGTYQAGDPGFGDTGGASRFFYVSKPSRRERDAGLEHLPPVTGGEATDREEGSAGLDNPRAGAGRNGGSRNVHPTVKPVTLMRYLCRLITPPGGTVLDPFNGSGTTGIAALAEGFSYIGIEREPQYLEIARARIAHWHGAAPEDDGGEEAEADEDAAPTDRRQLTLFGAA